MGIFSSIKDAIFGKKAEAAEPAAPAAPSPVGSALDAATQAMAAAAAAPVDVEAILAAEAAKTEQELNWRTSIVDLMKLVGIDSSLANRKELAQELGYTGALYGWTAIILSAIFVALSAQVGTRATHEGDRMRPEKRLFAFSIAYLFILFGAVVADHWWPL